MSAEDTSQAATKIARQNISNIVAKLRSGKTLSISEQKAMERWEAETNDGEWVKDTSALAKELGLNRGAIYDARAKYGEEAPKKEQGSRRENLRAWQKFCAEKLIGKDGASHTLAELKAQMMRRDIEIRDLKIARERAEVVETEVCVLTAGKNIAESVEKKRRRKEEGEGPEEKGEGQGKKRGSKAPKAVGGEEATTGDKDV